jgi:hypothetical protein
MRVFVRVAIMCVFLAMASVRPAFAQEAGSIGLSIGHPAAVGFVWQVTNRIAIRPEVDLVLGGSSYSFGVYAFPFPGIDGSSTTESETWTLGAGVSALFTVYQAENLSVYVAPQYSRFGTRSEQFETITVGGVSTSSPPERSTSSGHTFSGSLGVRYRLGERFGVFGEAGVTQDREDVASPYSIGSSDDASYSLTRLRSGVGVVFWF